MVGFQVSTWPEHFPGEVDACASMVPEVCLWLVQVRLLSIEHLMETRATRVSWIHIFYSEGKREIRMYCSLVTQGEE